MCPFFVRTLRNLECCNGRIGDQHGDGLILHTLQRGMTGGRKWFNKKNPLKNLVHRFRRRGEQAASSLSEESGISPSSADSSTACTCGALSRNNGRLMDKMCEEEEEVAFNRDCPNMLVEWKPHTQVDYVHFLVPDLTSIISSPHYWAKMDRYEAENELENKPEGSFLLRDSAQEEYIFSVSFRRYGRSLHARIEESDHFFSFDCHDPGVYKSKTIPQLLQHYKDPTSCMFFEPLLYCPVNRPNPFSLQEIARANICDRLKSYSSIDELELPRSVKLFLKEYHYRHKIRTRRLD